MEIYKMLILSTAHLPEDYAKCPVGWFHIASAPEGVLVYVPKEPDDNEQNFLVPIFDLARKHEVAHIWFDSDGDIVPELPQFDWE